ncbi:hypothetical protein ACFQZZ_28735 [Nocardia sp. GCM10030253]|uniref:hypothetical protein n=1 Tax=Nocardia sp. GCM10030253 TaxID=3273404 RepID=UPI00362D2372
MHTGTIASDEQIELNGLHVTSAARTIVDLARTVPFEQAIVVGDAALRMSTTTRDELAEQLDRARHRSGRPAAQRVVDFLDGRSESVGESRSRVALRQSDLPAPELQARIIGLDATTMARVDFLWPELGVIGEFDGMVKYHKEMRGDRLPEQVVIEEKAREDALRALGWIVVRWTWQDLEHPSPFRARLAAAADIARHTARLGTWRSAPHI